MKVKQLLNEGLGDEAQHMERDHEVQMARAQLYHAASDAVRLHKLLQHVSETEGLEGWVQSKITLAADYLKKVADYMEYEKMGSHGISPMPQIAVGEDVPVNEMTSSSSVAAVAKPMGRAIKRRKGNV